jgi:hypothetical protein
MERKIVIQGQNNRYQMKKLVNEKKESVVRKSFHPVSLETQMAILHSIYKEFFPEEKDLDPLISFSLEERNWIMKEIENKRFNYKQQDLLKKRWNESLFVSYPSIIQRLY